MMDLCSAVHVTAFSFGQHNHEVIIHVKKIHFVFINAHFSV